MHTIVVDIRPAVQGRTYYVPVNLAGARHTLRSQTMQGRTYRGPNLLTVQAETCCRDEQTIGQSHWDELTLRRTYRAKLTVRRTYCVE